MLRTTWLRGRVSQESAVHSETTISFRARWKSRVIYSVEEVIIEEHAVSFQPWFGEAFKLSHLHRGLQKLFWMLNENERHRCTESNFVGVVHLSCTCIFYTEILLLLLYSFESFIFVFSSSRTARCHIDDQNLNILHWFVTTINVSRFVSKRRGYAPFRDRQSGAQETTWDSCLRLDWSKSAFDVITMFLGETQCSVLFLIDRFLLMLINERWSQSQVVICKRWFVLECFLCFGPLPLVDGLDSLYDVRGMTVKETMNRNTYSYALVNHSTIDEWFRIFFSCAILRRLVSCPKWRKLDNSVVMIPFKVVFRRRFHQSIHARFSWSNSFLWTMDDWPTRNIKQSSMALQIWW